MKVSGFTYMRNSFKYGYPVIESIKSILPLCDEFIAVVGKSEDGTREAIEAIGSDKIRIIDTVWDDDLIKGGKVFAQQSNIGLKAVTGDWAFHIQSDEVFHEDDLAEIKKAMEDNLHDKKVEGFLFNFLHFIGDYKHRGTTRKWHRREIRIIRNDPSYYSYKDSQGFRSYPSLADYEKNTNSRKLKVKLLNARIFHYSYCRNPDLLLGKVKSFGSYYAPKEHVLEHYKKFKTFDFGTVADILAPFEEPHPATMKDTIAAQDWTFKHNPNKIDLSPRRMFLHRIEMLTGWRIGEYKNYIIIK
ncbi:glycosyltransferase involved in cell wall biosynthesis [Pedobacter cryoconitis]|uniref:Glycosyltransferase involved in cell wall biosynthesis n=1 Tax=Pedobacter cryoconitis TaxID=188932 RepID=A0A7W8YR13_9SPHI|nr:glycosyltransferase [Pedobacter cryoconitis]MBB5620247.1 glycosyltransferase involved in cell wall biosynthesis [Pedobacter cryoconitis]MBB5648372.1 glycosyltransferase involved in cell wall biosynthesis [Pedobacter cryoconitis]